MPHRPSPSRRKEITRLSINLGRLPFEISPHIIEIIKAKRDTPTLLSLIRTCRRLYHNCAPTLYEDLDIADDNYRKILFGLGPNFDGPPLPRKAPGPTNDKDPFARKYNLLRCTQSLTIENVEPLEAILDIRCDFWDLEPEATDPSMDIFTDLYTLIIAPMVIYDIEDDPKEWEEVFEGICNIGPIFGICYHTGPYPSDWWTSKVIKQGLINVSGMDLSMHVYDLDFVCVDKYEMERIQIFFCPLSKIDDKKLRKKYPADQRYTIQEFMVRHFDRRNEDFIGVNPRLKKIEFHNVIYCDDLQESRKQPKITQWLTRTKVDGQFTEVPSSIPDATSHDIQASSSSDVMKGKPSYMPPWVISLFDDEEVLTQIDQMVEFWPARENCCRICCRNGYGGLRDWKPEVSHQIVIETTGVNVSEQN
ncbi:hypothetical protein L486_08431 [Kwoniella mangroviensis CBS 10435]|uniref:F-box domain-containing protein n=1 Tax=Kwoniella mangroviensis CBS 10435 TaxID=1331196 RepID=A0A1B9IES4_9TREE|nr:hypothetical protein L486_08431 [Kwoniella mangroviensis CBS 10435]